jgi:hypothetical protein
MPHFCAGATADPAPLIGQGGLARGARAGGDTLAIANDVRCFAGAAGWVHRGRCRVTVRASEPAGIVVDARGNSISWVVAVRRCIDCDLKKMLSGAFWITVAFHRTRSVNWSGVTAP